MIAGKGILQKYIPAKARAATLHIITFFSASRQTPGAPAVRPQAFGHGAAREPGKLSKLSHSELFELRVPLRRERQERERQRREELAGALVGDDQDLPGARDVRRCECGEPALGSAHAWIPGRADGGERALERSLEPAVKTFDSARLEVDAAEVRGVDREARVLEPAEHSLPLLAGGGRILFDENEAGTGRERLAQAHARPHAHRVGGRGHGAEQGLRSRQWSKRGRPLGKHRFRTERRAQLEAGDDDAGDHRERMFYRTGVRMSRSAPEQVFCARHDFGTAL